MRGGVILEVNWQPAEFYSRLAASEIIGQEQHGAGGGGRLIPTAKGALNLNVINSLSFLISSPELANLLLVGPNI